MSNESKLIHILIYSHFFKIILKTSEQADKLKGFVYKFQNYIKERDGSFSVLNYCIINKIDKEYHFHINAFQMFKNYLKDNLIDEKEFLFTQVPLNEGKSIELKVKDGFSPRDYQVPIIDYFENKKYDSGAFIGQKLRQTFIGIQTGEGKTITSSFCAEKLGKRVLICVRPLFLKKWAEDIFNIFNIKKEETVAVSGNAQLKGLISIAKTKEFEKVKVILVSLPTLRNWFNLYEEKGRQAAKDEGYEIDPEQFYPHLDVGLRIIDEVHVDFHFNFRHDLFTHTQKSVSLSATLLHLDSFTKNMQYIAYPREYRYNGGALKKYTKAYAVLYNFKDQRRINYKEWGSNNYSHIAFEKSIMNKKNNGLLENYCGLIYDILNIKFLPNFKKGDKAVVYAATKVMCEEIAKFLKKQLPDMDVRRYIMEDKYENLLEPDIRVTTLLSGGTGHDIKGLTDVVLTNCMQSIQQNIQVLGRLREIPNGETRFYYLTCYGNEKQMKYHNEKLVMLRERAKSVDILPYDMAL